MLIILVFSLGVPGIHCQMLVFRCQRFRQRILEVDSQDCGRWHLGMLQVDSGVAGGVESPGYRGVESGVAVA